MNWYYKYKKYKEKYNKIKNNYCEDFVQLFVKRLGKNKNSFMITENLLDIYEPYQILLQKTNVLDKISCCNSDVYILTKTHILDIKKPKQLIIKGRFTEESKHLNITSNNILGSNDYFHIEETNDQIPNLIIPVEETKQDYLGYYNVFLIDNNEKFNLNNPQPIGLFDMNIGIDYVKDFLLVNGLGDGFYIESHDLPHYYYPQDLDPQGYIILGEKLSDGFGLTAFKIKPNTGLYLSPYTHHSDAYLIGNYNVVYGKTSNYKTWLFRDKQNQIVNIKCN